MHKQIRVGQLIAPFGPGSIYTDRRGLLTSFAGLTTGTSAGTKRKVGFPARTAANSSASSHASPGCWESTAFAPRQTFAQLASARHRHRTRISTRPPSDFRAGTGIRARARCADST